MTTDPSAPATSIIEPSTATVSTVSRKWTLKMMLIALALIAFGLYGLYDALVSYPKRGAEASEFLEYQYLQSLSTAGQLSRASIADPATTLRDLREKERNATITPADHAAAAWLEQLEFIHRLEPASESTKIPRTDFRGDTVADSDARLATLKKRWTTDAGGTKSASPLGVFDIPSQWVILAVGAGIGAYLLVLVVRVKSKTYRWDPATQRLTLPGGASFVPSDIEEVDKRKWHRLYVALKIKRSHPQLGGYLLNFDLMRYEPVEAWILEMERTAFPENVQAVGLAADPATEPAPG